MGRFGMQLLAQIEGWRLSLTGTLTGENCNTLEIFRVSDGSVFTKDAGFKVLLGQTEEFPLLQVSLLPFTTLLSTLIIFTSRLSTSVSLLERSTVWRFLEATSPQAEILPHGNLRVGCSQSLHVQMWW